MPLNIDRRFVDVDLAAEARRLGIATGYTRRPGQSFASAAKGLYADYGDEFEILPDAERTKRIAELDEKGGIENLVRWILNQKQEGSCVGNAETQGLQVIGAKQFGEANMVPLSAISAYKQIGSSPNSGASIDDALEKGSTVGVLPLDTPENRQRFGSMVMPATGFYTPWPSGDWKSVAGQFRIDKTLIIRSVPAMEQAGINGHVVVVGRRGHSILYLRPTLRQGRGELYVNSWSIDWGFAAGGQPGGFGFDSSGLVAASADWAFAIVSVVVPNFILQGAK